MARRLKNLNTKNVDLRSANERKGAGQTLNKSLGAPLAAGYFGNNIQMNTESDSDWHGPQNPIQGGPNWYENAPPEGEMGWSGMNAQWAGQYSNPNAGTGSGPALCDDPWAFNYGQPGPCGYDQEEPDPGNYCEPGYMMDSEGYCIPEWEPDPNENCAMFGFCGVYPNCYECPDEPDPGGPGCPGPICPDGNCATMTYDGPNAGWGCF